MYAYISTYMSEWFIMVCVSGKCLTAYLMTAYLMIGYSQFLKFFCFVLLIQIKHVDFSVFVNREEKLDLWIKDLHFSK